MKGSVVKIVFFVILGWNYFQIPVSGQFCFTPNVDNAYFFTPQNLGTSTPQVTDMICYGNIQVNKYHGLLDFGIQLEGYKDIDFDIPISLKYISSGFVPSKRPSYVGYNWVLNCGGVVTRTLNGSPDDTRGCYRNSEYDDYLLDGILVAMRDGRFVNYSDDDLMNFRVEYNSKGHGTFYEGNDFKYEFEPDIFTFSFGGYFGRFIMGKDGRPVLLEENGCKIDIDGMSVQSYSTFETPLSSTIKIITPDGFIYTFGGESNYLEYFTPNNPDKCKKMPRYITSWFLKSITTPFGRVANFNYISKMQINKYRYLSYMRTASYTQIVCTDASTSQYADEDIESENFIVRDKIYTPVLNYIKIDETKIQFSYIENSLSFYEGESEDKLLQLSKIKHYSDNILLKEASFSYVSKNRYFFLQSISQNGLKHSFKYNLSQELPDPLTISLDHWGFWSGGYETGISDKDAYCTNIKENRKVNPNVCSVGLLNEIVYPTGGMSKIEYENNRYNIYFTRNPYFFILTKTEINKPLPCGGARVKMVQDFHSKTRAPINTRRFLYQSSLGEEMGVIGIEPKYKINERFTSYGYTSAFPVICSVGVITELTNISANSFGSNNLFSEYHVGYPYVKEIFMNNGFVQSSFSSWIDIPDLYSNTVKTTHMTPTNLGTYGIAEKYGTYITNDMSRFRGRLLEEITSDVSGDVVYRIRNKYNVEDAGSKYHISLISSPRSLGNYKILLTPCLLIQQETTDQNGVTKQVDYSYNEKSFIRKQKTINSDGKSLSVIYEYPFEFENFNNDIHSEAIMAMLNLNMIKSPIETAVLSENDTSVVSAVMNRYYVSSGLPFLSSIYQFESNTPVLYHSPEYYSKFRIKETFGFYRYGRLISMRTKDNMHVAYIWGYCNKYPIAEVKNVFYADLIARIPEYRLASIASKIQPSTDDWNLINNLRSQFTEAQITTYTYKPLVGLLTVTDPHGVISYYEYDSFGRLQYLKDKNTNIINSYDYHYLNPNE